MKNINKCEKALYEVEIKYFLVHQKNPLLNLLLGYSLRSSLSYDAYHYLEIEMGTK